MPPSLLSRRVMVVGLVVLAQLACTATASAQFTALNGIAISAEAFDAFLKRTMDSLGVPGVSVAVMEASRIVHHRAIGIANVDTRATVDDASIFETASMSKPVFAYLVMRMVDKGVLDLDRPLYTYLPYPDIERDDRYKLTTARMILTHHAGFPNWRYFNRADTSLHVHYPDLYLKFTPGSAYWYSGEGFLYLAKVVAALNGTDLQGLERVYEAEVAVPLGMQHAWFTGNAFITQHKVNGHVGGKVRVDNKMNWPVAFPNQDSSWFNPAASLHADAVSYARFVIALMDGTGLSAKARSEMLRAEYPVPDSLSHDRSEHTEVALGIFVTSTPYGRRYEHGGNNGNFKSQFLWYAEQRKGYVLLTNGDRGDDLDARLRTFFATGR